MDSRQNFGIICKTANQTQLLGRCIGARLKSGALIRLAGSLGSGKTCFVQGLARGLEVPPGYDITSPTYALVHEYPGRLPLVHVDLYRLSGEMDAEAIGLWDFIDSRHVVAVEWADRIDDASWPRESWQIVFESLTDEIRRIQLIAYGLHMGNLIKEVLAFWEAGGKDPSTS